jgi:predicted DNA-binding transcriptional regulator YafY
MSTGVRFTPRTLPAKDAGAYVEQSISGAPNRFEAHVTVHAAAAEVAARVPPGWGTIAPIDDHTCRYSTGGDDPRWLALRLAMLGVDFEAHEPPELVEQLQALALRLGRATQSRSRGQC